MILKLSCFRHHRDLELILPDSGVVLFAGASGSGKSTVLAALEFVLYGKLRKVSSFDTNTTSVSLVYHGIALRQLADVDGHFPSAITILRKRGPALFRLTCGDTIYEGDEAQGIVCRMFGGHDVFMASSYLKQGERSLLLDGKNADKMELIEKFTFSDDDISSRKETLQCALRDTDKALNTTNGILKMLESQIASFKVLHERPLSLLTQERSSRQPPPVVTVQSLEDEYNKVQTQREQYWQRKTELDVGELTRINTINSNTGIEQQVVKLQSTIKTDGGTASISELQVQLLEAGKELPTASQWEEYYRVCKQDETRLTDFKRRYPRYGTLKDIDDMPSVTEQHLISSELMRLEREEDEYRRYYISNESVRLELAELTDKLQTSLSTDHPPSVEEIDAYTSKASKELAIARRWQLYLQLRAEDHRRLFDFKRRYPQYSTERSKQKIDGSSIELATERAHLQRAEADYRTYQEQSARLRVEFPDMILTTTEITSQLELATWLEEHSSLTIPEHSLSVSDHYPDDMDTVHDLITATEDRHRSLTALVTSLQELGITQGDELRARLKDLRARLEKCGTKVQCPHCRENLIYNQGVLKCVADLRKPNPLPPRLGAPRPIIVAPPPSTSQEEEKESPESMTRQLSECERVEALLITDNPNVALRDCETERQSLRDWRQQLQQILIQREASRVKLARREELETLINGRTTTFTTIELKKLLIRIDKIKEALPVDIERLKEVEKQLTLLEQSSLFLQQDEIEFQALEKRLMVLRELYPEAERAELVVIDSTTSVSPTRNADIVASELELLLSTWKRYHALLPTLRDLAPVNTERLSQLRQQLAIIDRQRQERELVATFRQQDELELQATTHRLNLLQRLHPTVPRSELENQPRHPVGMVASIEARIELLQRQLVVATKVHETRERIKTLQESIQPVPPSTSDELRIVVEQLAKSKERGEALQELKRCLALDTELHVLQGRLREQQTSSEVETKKYAVLDKLRLKLLEAETIALESTVASINLELAQQLDGLFDTPISVRFETTKQLGNGGSRHCVNLSVHYRGQNYDDIDQLSGGEAARVSLAITLALNKTASSPLLLLDESLSALDGELVDTVIDALKIASSSSNIPIFVVLHNNVQGVFDEVITF